VPHGVELPQLGAEVLQSEAGLCLTQLAGRQQLLHTHKYFTDPLHKERPEQNIFRHLIQCCSPLKGIDSLNRFWKAYKNEISTIVQAQMVFKCLALFKKNMYKVSAFLLAYYNSKNS
jgi:hypothetical protein